MTEAGEYVPPVEALVPYQSAIASFRRKLPEDESVAMTISILSPAESYAIMIQRELESRAEYGFTVTLTRVRTSAAPDGEAWRVFALSGPQRLGDLTEEEHHAVTGWAFAVAAYFRSTLLSFAYRV